MGTNYYHNDERGNSTHIGKSSGGWCFSLWCGETFMVLDWDTWKFKLQKGSIVNEYGDTITYSNMIDIVTNRSTRPNLVSEIIKLDAWYKTEEDFWRLNNAQPGPNGLLRHKLSTSCVGHGEGTFDYIIGSFS